MTGTVCSSDTLNKTLLFIVKLLNDNNIQDWFIGYGTLLGIVRNNSCIDGDNDVDIIIDENNFDLLKNLLIENNLPISGNRRFLKIDHNDRYSSVDFYMATLYEKGNFHDLWENVVWTECYNEKKRTNTIYME